ncbi:CBS domain-containing protein [Thiomicrorhabdus arctica]|jgi:acetoin utilization protein AcuB|uniref:CBS domain-containing protein n=1 Tax=Thiomicrorhabdus arctica TaxID=131540 RepID=UPI00037FDF7B|nr:CBS domain-containing protein [Thiomicrorhabdus arctica]
MFIVYAPEGRSFIGRKPKVPPLKVDPLIPINPIEKDVLDGRDSSSEITSSAQTHQKTESAVHAYEVTQEDKRRRVIVKVVEIMSAPVVLVSDENSLEEAWLLMQEHKVSYLPVIKAGILVGLCSQADLLGRVIVNKDGVLEGVKQETVAEVMHSQVVTTSSDTDIRHIAQVLSDYDIGALVIMSEFHEVVGIVTEGDLVKRLANDPPVELYV